MNPSDRARLVAIDRLGALVESMQGTARAQRAHEHGDAEATEQAADLIWQFRKQLRREGVMTVQEGDTVKAFHPRMFGVVKHGTVVSVGPVWCRVDFGELLGGECRLPRTHIIEIEETAKP